MVSSACCSLLSGPKSFHNEPNISEQDLLSNLSDDCLLAIFDQFNCNDLDMLSHVSQKLGSLAAIVRPLKIVAANYLEIFQTVYGDICVDLYREHDVSYFMCLKNQREKDGKSTCTTYTYTEPKEIFICGNQRTFINQRSFQERHESRTDDFCSGFCLKQLSDIYESRILRKTPKLREMLEAGCELRRGHAKMQMLPSNCNHLIPMFKLLEDFVVDAEHLIDMIIKHFELKKEGKLCLSSTNPLKFSDIESAIVQLEGFEYCWQDGEVYKIKQQNWIATIVKCEEEYFEYYSVIFGDYEFY
ncbi:hypothetical protein PRIPAC_83397 [Pristionchus pacificus]|uniref:Uncharacterized protein n=1 Tax=Pristionchus pacificus TaxID=54126 RepID=A0A2A6BTU5_PRIPA|nr:hypothetical protein PRIPAC_83397 [Pristionchus pacificus]|eukprot:PDM69349.1 hypothetical protein PRIPAC_47651 [Pristionchus pacificus]